MLRVVPCCGVAAFVAGAIVIIIRKKAQHSEPDLGPVPGPPAAVEKNYGDALKIAMQFFDVQRSGKLVNNKISCRGDSALKDGSKAKLDLSKGMYEVGDHMKFGFPKAFTATVLSWAILKYGDQMQTVNLLKPAQNSLKWITDYLVNAHPSENVLYIQVGDSEADHKCWDRPETMTEKRPLTQVNTSSPGTEVAAETAAAMASASLACYGDELLWAASWLHHVTGDQSYFDYVTGKNGKAFAKWGSPTWFSWENKLAGSQVLLSRISFFFFVPKTHPTQKTSRSTGKLPRLSCVGSCQNLQQPHPAEQINMCTIEEPQFQPMQQPNALMVFSGSSQLTPTRTLQLEQSLGDPS